MFEVWELMALDFEERREKLLELIRQGMAPYEAAVLCGFDYNEMLDIVEGRI